MLVRFRARMEDRAIRRAWLRAEMDRTRAEVVTRYRVQEPSGRIRYVYDDVSLGLV